MYNILLLFFAVFISANLFAQNDFSGLENISLQISKELGYLVNEKDILQKIDLLAGEIRKESKYKEDLPDLIIKKIYSIPMNEKSKINFPEEEGLLSFLISTGSGNCFSYSILFLTLGEKLGVNFTPVLIPGHVYLRYNNRNIETTLDGKNVSDKNIANLLYLDYSKTQFISATRNQFISGLYSNACIIAAYRGNLKKGIEYCDLAIKYNANNGEAFINKSFIEGANGLYHQSLESARYGVKIYPQLGHAYFTLGNAYKKLKKMDEAVEALKKSIAIRPNIFRAHFNLGNIYLDQHKLKEAISSFSETIRLNPEYNGAYVNRAISYSMSKNYLQAIRDYTFLIKNGSQNFDVIFERGKSYYALKKYQLALKDFEVLQKQFAEKAKLEGVDQIIMELKNFK